MKQEQQIKSKPTIRERRNLRDLWRPGPGSTIWLIRCHTKQIRRYSWDHRSSLSGLPKSTHHGTLPCLVPTTVSYFPEGQWIPWKQGPGLTDGNGDKTQWVHMSFPAIQSCVVQKPRLLCQAFLLLPGPPSLCSVLVLWSPVSFSGGMCLEEAFLWGSSWSQKEWHLQDLGASCLPLPAWSSVAPDISETSNSSCREPSTSHFMIFPSFVHFILIFWVQSGDSVRDMCILYRSTLVKM